MIQFNNNEQETQELEMKIRIYLKNNKNHELIRVAYPTSTATRTPNNWKYSRLIIYECVSRPDRERIKEVGPERSCAEWLLRCGANVRWKGADNWLRDFNLLPPVNMKNYVIEELEAVEAGIMTIGFDHFGWLTVEFSRCFIKLHSLWAVGLAPLSLFETFRNTKRRLLY